MDSFGALAAVVLLVAFWLITFGLALLADGDCRSLLTAWVEEGGIMILRCRRCWLIPQVDPPSPMRVVYRVTAVDRQGQLRTGWASVAVKFPAGETVATGVEVRWTRVREFPMPVSPSLRLQRDPLWDRWVDS